MLTLEGTTERLGITHDQLIMVGILIGTDFNPGGISGLGPKKALALVKEKKTMEAVFGGVQWNFTTTPQQIFDFFKHPPVTDYKIEFGQPDLEKIKHLMCDEHEFSEERIENAIKKLSESKTEQRSLSRW